MKNKEKHAKEIVEIACKGHDFMVDKSTNEVADCCDAPCTACLFLEMEDCDKARREWAESEYIEKPVISKRDREFLEYLNGKIKYITRDGAGGVVRIQCEAVQRTRSLDATNGRIFQSRFLF